MSAAAFLLNRAGAQDGFLETICRLVSAGENLLTAVEAAEAAGFRPQAFLDDLAARADFPTPIFRQERRAIWRKSDIERYLQSHPTLASPPAPGPPGQ
jgi:predicted DNA-binding transcriptional regulator AlpA